MLVIGTAPLARSYTPPAPLRFHWPERDVCHPLSPTLPHRVGTSHWPDELSNAESGRRGEGVLKGGVTGRLTELSTSALFLLAGRRNAVLWLAAASAHYQPGLPRWEKGGNHAACWFFERRLRGGVTGKYRRGTASQESLRRKP